MFALGSCNVSVSGVPGEIPDIKIHGKGGGAAAAVGVGAVSVGTKSGVGVGNCVGVLPSDPGGVASRVGISDTTGEGVATD